MKLSVQFFLSLGLLSSVQPFPHGADESNDALGFERVDAPPAGGMRVRRRLKGSKSKKGSKGDHKSGSKGHSKSHHVPPPKPVSSKSPPKPIPPPVSPKPVHPPVSSKSPPKPVPPPVSSKPVRPPVSSKSPPKPAPTPVPPPSGKGKGKGYWPPPPPPGKGKGYWPPPPEGKGKGKGYSPPPPPEGKGKGYWPPPPPEGKGKGYWPPPPPEGKGKGGAVSGKGKGSVPPPGKGKGYAPPPGKGKGYAPPPGKGKGSIPLEPECEEIQITFYKDELRARYTTGEFFSTFDTVPFYNSNDGQLLGYYSDESANLSNGDCIGTSVFSFGLDPYLSQINLQFTCNGEYNGITGGNGLYGCATGYEFKVNEDDLILQSTLNVCGPLCPYVAPEE